MEQINLKCSKEICLQGLKNNKRKFEKERKNKRKLGLNFVKQIKKHLNSKQTEAIKNIKRQNQNMQRRYLNLSSTVKTYWQKIDKITNNFNCRTSHTFISIRS